MRRRDEVLRDWIAPLAADVAARTGTMSLVANGSRPLRAQLHALALRVLSGELPSLVPGPLRRLARALLGPPTLLRFGLCPFTHDRHPLPPRGTCGAGGRGPSLRLPMVCWSTAPEPPANGSCSVERVTSHPRVKRHARAALVFFMTASPPSRAQGERPGVRSDAEPGPSLTAMPTPLLAAARRPLPSVTLRVPREGTRPRYALFMTEPK